ncbi:hypothetical protein A0257_04545 [Hymenobacter psoromatis]|nr:hypothetical protein A0257_04545 [Hymenobacter psoromatis]
MKTSTTFLLAALLVLLASLTAYNMALRAEYRSGAFKDPLHDYATLKFSNFTEVEAPAAGVVGIKIIAGPYRVRISPRAAKYVQVHQQGSRLVITAAFPDQRVPLGQTAVVISCPQLTQLTANADYALNGARHRDKQEIFFAASPVVVEGFTQDSLSVQQDNATHIELIKNNLKFLRVVAGATPGSHSILQMGQDNRIAAANLALNHQSELQLYNLAIPQLQYHFADSAKAILTGAALVGLRQ